MSLAVFGSAFFFSYIWLGSDLLLELGPDGTSLPSLLEVSEEQELARLSFRLVGFRACFGSFFIYVIYC